jgi:uncharacterized damage-inducible protein DinB
MSVESLFVNASAAKLRKSCEQIATCVGKLNEDQVWARGHENENAIGNLALHLAGNVRQWIISGIGGAEDNRIRDLEFSTESGIAPAELLARLSATVEQAATVIEALTAEQLTRAYTIQGVTGTGLEAVLHVTAHFALHTGQIIYITKHVTGEDLAFFAPKNPGRHPGFV